MEFVLSLLHDHSLEQKNRKLNVSQVGRKRKNNQQDFKRVWSCRRARSKCQTKGLRLGGEYKAAKGLPTTPGEFKVCEIGVGGKQLSGVLKLRCSGSKQAEKLGVFGVAKVIDST